MLHSFPTPPPPLLQINGRYVSHRNLTIEGKEGTRERPIIICGSENAIIDGRDFVKDDWSSYWKTGMPLLTVRRCNFVTVAGLAYRYGYVGVQVELSSNCRVQNTAISSISTSGFLCHKCSNVLFRDSSVTRSWVGKCSLLHGLHPR